MTHVMQAFCGVAFATMLMLSTTQAATADAASAKQAIAEAVDLQMHAMSLDNGWSVTQAELKQAHAAYAEQDYATALATAQHAQQLARISIAQAESQKKLWRSEVPH